mmetsp:Transcript_32993/g.45778  ORF Transcript_32993/g.45778 Transcript_32993/m.45778 type:complete len:116 (-) Transcript_32993:347-694(-)
MANLLRSLSKVRIQFNPQDGRVAAVREFLQRCHTPKAVQSNPKCDVETTLRIDRQPPVVEFTFLNGEKLLLNCAALKVEDIVTQVTKMSDKIDREEMLKEYGGLKALPFINMLKN